MIEEQYVSDETSNLLDMKICSVIEAHGGWTCMDYLIKFEKQLEDKS